MKTDRHRATLAATREEALAEDYQRLKAAGLKAAWARGPKTTALDVERRTNCDTDYLVRITFGAAYPFEIPRARIVHPRLADDAPHRYGDGALCIALDWDPRAHDVLAFVAAIDAYIALYERFRLTGEGWAPERPHPPIGPWLRQTEGTGP